MLKVSYRPEGLVEVFRSKDKADVVKIIFIKVSNSFDESSSCSKISLKGENSCTALATFSRFEFTLLVNSSIFE